MSYFEVDLSDQPIPTTDSNGDTYWRLPNGKIHREDGPAIEYANGSKFWYQNGKRHRLDGPAEEYADGTKFWYQNGKLHRLDGPAREYSDGTKSWWINGRCLPEEEFNQRVNVLL